MSGQQIVEVRKIPVKDDQVLEVEMTQKFIDHLRQHFGLFVDQPVEDEHVRSYVLGAVNTAVVKAERELENAPKPATDPVGIRRPRRRKKSTGS